MTDDQKALLVPLVHLRGTDLAGLWCIYDEEAALILDEDWSCDRLLLALESDLDGVPAWEAADALQLSTERAANRDWLARWVARQVGFPELLTTAPRFYGDLRSDGLPMWRLTDEEGASEYWSERHGSHPDIDEANAVAAVAGLEPGDERRLFDGSRWVDAAALAAVVRHMAERP